MPFQVFTPGQSLAAADLNSYLMQQANITCTSGSRPASPVEGMNIYETDTDRVYIYSGSAWVLVYNIALGAVTQRVATAVYTSNGSNATTTELQVWAVTGALVSGRTYRVTVACGIQSSVANDVGQCRIREDTVSGTQMQITRMGIETASSSHFFTMEAEYTAGATANKTFSGTLIRAAGSGALSRACAADQPGYMYVDIVR